MSDTVAVMRGTINDSPWGNMEITDASFQSSSSPSSESNNSRAAAAAAARNRNRSNAYVVRAPDDGHHDFLLPQQNEPENDEDMDDDDEDDECCLGCCSRRRWRMRFLQLGSVVDFLLGILLLTYGGILAHHSLNSPTASSSSSSIIKAENVLCSAFLWTGSLFLLRVVFLTIAVTCQRMSRRAGGIDAHDVGCCQGCSLVAVVYIFTPLLLVTFFVSSIGSAIFHQSLFTCLSQLLQQLKQAQEEEQAPRLAFATRYFIVPILEFSVHHSHWIWLLFLVWSLIEFLRRKLYVWHYEDVYKQEEASMVPSWQRQRALQEGGAAANGGGGGARRFFSSSDGRPWWWDRSRSFRSFRRRRAPAVGNENLTEALLQDDYANSTSVGRQHRNSPQGRGGRSWWRIFSRSNDDDIDHDNIRDDASVDFASAQEEWEIRSQGNPTWWAQDDDDDLGFLPPARAEATDLSWAEQQQQRQQRNDVQ